MTFEMTRIKQRLADLEKGYKELSFWHDQWKRLHLKASEASVKNTELQGEVHETMKVMNQAILELLDRVKKLEQKNTGKDHP
tara:strand:+ start:260 stop:505 length:246 start_codon:yes stop_codon:yes gene_type:complete